MGAFVVGGDHQLALHRLHRHRLVVHPPDHVERTLRPAAQRRLQQVLLDPPLDHLAQVVADLEEPVRRAQPPDPLVRTAQVVVLHPQPNPLLRLLEAVELRPAQELAVDVLPEPLDLAQRHRMVRTRPQVPDLVLRQLMLEPRLAAPVGVLAAVVREHLPRHPVLARRPPVRLEHMLRRLAPVQAQPDDVPRVVVDVADQVRVLPAQTEREDVRLPELVRRRALEEPRLRRRLRGANRLRLAQPALAQRRPHRLRARRQVEPAPQRLRDPLRPSGRILPLQLHDLVLDRRRTLLAPRMAEARHRMQTRLAADPVGPHPAEQRVLGDPRLRADRRHVEPFLDPQLHHPQTELERIRPMMPPSLARRTGRLLPGGGLARAPGAGRIPFHNTRFRHACGGNLLPLSSLFYDPLPEYLMLSHGRHSFGSLPGTSFGVSPHLAQPRWAINWLLAQSSSARR